MTNLQTKILSVALNGYETSSLNLLIVFQKSELKGIFEPKTEKVTVEWRKLHNDDFIIYTSHQIILQ
jgi:hypothetical protein